VIPPSSLTYSTLAHAHPRPARLQLLEAKTVGFFGGLCLLFNTLTGPGIPFTAVLFQQVGWPFTLAFFLLFAVIVSISVLLIVETIQAIPGNKHFQVGLGWGVAIIWHLSMAGASRSLWPVAHTPCTMRHASSRTQPPIPPHPPGDGGVLYPLQLLRPLPRLSPAGPGDTVWLHAVQCHPVHRAVRPGL
jgi:hypothetical protein